MGLAFAALIAFALIDFAILFGISRLVKLDKFSVGECILLPLSLFLFTGMELRASGFDAAPWPLIALCYTLNAILVFSLIGLRKNGFPPYWSSIKNSLLTALLFSAIHFVAYSLIGLAIGK